MASVAVDSPGRLQGLLGGRAWSYTRPLLILGSVLLFWQVSAILIDDPLFLPTVDEVVARAANLWSGGVLLGHLLISLQRAILGFLIASVAGIVIGMLAGSVPWLRKLLDPLVAASYPIPKIGLIPLFILWMGIGESSKLAVIVTAAIYPVIINVQAAVASIDTRLIWHARTLGVDRWRLFLRVTLPAALPGMFVGLRLAMGLSWILLFAAEMVASSQGLGFLIIRSQQLFDTSGVFVSLVTIALLGMFFDGVIQLLYHRICHWHVARGEG